MSEKPKFLTGRFLLAMPGMGDPRFEQAAILVAAHDEDGAIGIGVGHSRVGVTVRDLIEQLDLDAEQAPKSPVLHGGPVEPGRGFVIHSNDWGGQDTVQVADLCSMTATLDVLKAIGAGRGPAKYIVALGYAGWTAGQLEEEMTRHGWFVADADETILFDAPPEDRWTDAYKAVGIDPALLSSASGEA